jgi:hypothetical protein
MIVGVGVRVGGVTGGSAGGMMLLMVLPDVGWCQRSRGAVI